jgi:hypothetical protein
VIGSNRYVCYHLWTNEPAEDGGAPSSGHRVFFAFPLHMPHSRVRVHFGRPSGPAAGESGGPPPSGPLNLDEPTVQRALVESALLLGWDGVTRAEIVADPDLVERAAQRVDELRAVLKLQKKKTDEKAERARPRLFAPTSPRRARASRSG